jgi:carbon monoxide dehydrogenase subunit G
MRLEFAGSPVITATRQRVWTRLTDPNFVAASGPGVESVQTLDPTHFKVISGLGVGPIKVRFRLDVELFDIIMGETLKMRARGRAPGAAVEVISRLELQDAGPGRTRLQWSATSELSGTVASVGGRLVERTARKLTQEFWTDFARRAGVAEG